MKIKHRLSRLEKTRLRGDNSSLKEILLADGLVTQKEFDCWPEEKPLPSAVKTAADAIRFLDKQEGFHGQ